MDHERFTELEQDELDWISRFADRLRLNDERFAEEDRSDEANDIARSAWERPDWRCMRPEAAAERWLAEQPWTGGRPV
jgi:hypothetical protein